MRCVHANGFLFLHHCSIGDLSFILLSGGSEVHTRPVRARAYNWRRFKRSESAIVQNVKEIELYGLYLKGGRFPNMLLILLLLFKMGRHVKITGHYLFGSYAIP